MSDLALGAPIRINGLAAPGFNVGTGDIFDVIAGKESLSDWAGKAIRDVGGVAIKAGKVMIAPAVAPIQFAVNLGKGERIDQAALSTLKSRAKEIKDVAPYVRTVTSLVPGVGSGVAAAISAGAALAEGKRIDDALIAGVKGAIPGGPLASAAFDIAVSAAKGKNVTQATLDAARSQIPDGPEKTAFDTGLSLVSGQKIQAGHAPVLTGLAAAIVSAADQIKAAEEAKAKMDAARATVPPRMRTAPKFVPKPGPATDLAALAKLSPEEQKKLADWAALAKLTPDQQKALVEAAKPKAAPAPTATPAKPAVTSTPAKAAAPAPSAAPAAAAAPSRSPTEYGPYPPSTGAVHGLGFAWGDSKWRWFIVQANGKTIAQRGPVWLSDDAATREEASFLASTLGRGYIGTVTRWDWTGGSWQKAGPGSLSAPPHGKGWGGGGKPSSGHGGRPHSGRPFVQRGRGVPGWWGPWYGTPWSPEVSTVELTCRTWGDPIEMPPAMMQAARMALGASSQRPTAVRGPDGVLYLFAFDGGRITARPCVASAAA